MQRYLLLHYLCYMWAFSRQNMTMRATAARELTGPNDARALIRLNMGSSSDRNTHSGLSTTDQVAIAHPRQSAADIHIGHASAGTARRRWPQEQVRPLGRAHHVCAGAAV